MLLFRFFVFLILLLLFVERLLLPLYKQLVLLGDRIGYLIVMIVNILALRIEMIKCAEVSSTEFIVTFFDIF